MRRVSQRARTTRETQISPLSSLESLLSGPKNAHSSGSLLELLELPKFFVQARCQGQSPGIFDGETLSDILQAKEICNECPIRNECARWAIRTQDFGVWGSLTPGERRRKAKGIEVIDITEMRQLETNLANLSSKSPVEQLAAEFKVTPRTIYRWKKKFLATTKSNKKEI
jgi:hypothetical protein